MENVGERRWLPHMTFQEFYEMYLFYGSGEGKDKARRTTSGRCFNKQGWVNLLKFRKVAQHARCDTCARLTKAARVACTASDRKAAEEGIRAHRLRNFADRAVDFRLSQLSEASTTAEAKVKESRVLHIRIDGMDQAKFRCPRNMENS